MYIRWLMIFCDLLSLYPPVHFLSILLSSIIAITHNNSVSASTWNIPLQIFASAKLFLRCQFYFPGFYGFLNKFYDLVWYLVHFDTVYYSSCRDHIVSLFAVLPYYYQNCSSRLALLENVLIYLIYYYYYYYYYYCCCCCCCRCCCCLFLESFWHECSLIVFTGVWGTPNFLKSPRIFSVFWPFVIML